MIINIFSCTCKRYSVASFFFIYAIEPPTGLLAAWTFLCILTVQKQFRRLLYKDYTDMQLRYMFPLYILTTRAYKILTTKTKRTVKNWETQLSTRHRSVTDANHGFREICE